MDAPKVADLYLEGVDQFTGWFQSSMITSVAARGVSPFKYDIFFIFHSQNVSFFGFFISILIFLYFFDRSILVHGFTVDEKGLKMSKSLGNVINPKDIIENHSVDTLRWWVAEHLVGQAPISVKSDHFDVSANAITKVRKVLRYLVGYAEKLKLTDEPNQHLFNINLKTLSPLDTYILNSLAKFHEKIQCHASNYRFPIYINEINQFVVEDLSAFYIDNIKDKVYVNPQEETKETVKVLFAQFCILNKALWPIVPHLVEEVWSHYSKSDSFYKHQFTVPNEWYNTEFNAAMDIAKELIGMVKWPKTSWYFDMKIFATPQQIQELQVKF